MKRLRTYKIASAWLSAEMVGNYSWIHQFSAPEIAELELAAIKVLDNENRYSDPGPNGFGPTARQGDEASTGQTTAWTSTRSTWSLPFAR